MLSFQKGNLSPHHVATPNTWKLPPNYQEMEFPSWSNNRERNLAQELGSGGAPITTQAMQAQPASFLTGREREEISERGSLE